MPCNLNVGQSLSTLGLYLGTDLLDCWMNGHFIHIG
jgi:hypothetical protein